MTLPAAQLWFGSADALIHRAIAYAQTVLCRFNGCAVCSVCRQVQQQTYYALMWLEPEKNGYTVAQLEALDKRMVSIADPGERFLIVFERAHLLSTACANRLLKVVEEPPAGYHFLFLAESFNVVPTLVSRCLVDEMPVDTRSDHPLVTFFTQARIGSVEEFMRACSVQKINELETGQLLDKLIQHWAQRGAVEEESERLYARACSEQIMTAYEHLPMPGSGLFFWRNLFLKLQRIRHGNTR